MRARITFWISLCLNGVLLFYGVRMAYLAQQIVPVPARTVRLAPPEVVAKTNVVVRRQNLTWDEIESRDYRMYIQNLRAVGCPEQTIRDIIIADVEHLYAQRAQSEVVTADQQWWKSEPDAALMQAAFEKQNALMEERRALLDALLGPGWERSSKPSMVGFGGFNLSGPAFASLNPEARRQVEAIHQEANSRSREYLSKAQAEGRAPDPAELARLQMEVRQELGKVLTQDQLEEYLLRYSPLASGMRSELRGFDLNPDEFRAVFRARDAFDQQLRLLEGASDAATVRRREDLERQRELAVEKAFPTEKYPLFKLNQDPLFRQAQAAAQQIGAPAESVMPLYELQQAAQQEARRLRSDPSLTGEALEKALLEVAAEQRKSMRRVLGDAAYEKYLEQTGK